MNDLAILSTISNAWTVPYEASTATANTKYPEKQHCSSPGGDGCSDGDDEHSDQGHEDGDPAEVQARGVGSMQRSAKTPVPRGHGGVVGVGPTTAATVAPSPAATSPRRRWGKLTHYPEPSLPARQTG